MTIHSASFSGDGTTAVTRTTGEGRGLEPYVGGTRESLSDSAVLGCAVTVERPDAPSMQAVTNLVQVAKYPTVDPVFRGVGSVYLRSDGKFADESGEVTSDPAPIGKWLRLTVTRNADGGKVVGIDLSESEYGPA